MKSKLKVILIVSLIVNLSIVYVAIKALGYRSHINYYLDKYQNVVNEFSQRSVFASENERFAADTVLPCRVVFLGTQVIKNWDIEHHFPDFEAINRGIPGQRVSGFLLRFIPDVIELRPAAVLIEISSYNFRPQNSVKEIEDYMRSMIQLARANNINPIAATIIPLRRDSFDFGKYSIMDSIKVYNNWLKAYSSENDVNLVDFNKGLSDEQGYLRIDLSRSPIEPNEKGYKIMAEICRSELDKIVGANSLLHFLK